MESLRSCVRISDNTNHRRGRRGSPRDPPWSPKLGTEMNQNAAIVSQDLWWAPSSYKWSYNPSYKWVTGIILYPIAPFITYDFRSARNAKIRSKNKPCTGSGWSSNSNPIQYIYIYTNISYPHIQKYNLYRQWEMYVDQI